MELHVLDVVPADLDIILPGEEELRYIGKQGVYRSTRVPKRAVSLSSKGADIDAKLCLWMRKRRSVLIIAAETLTGSSSMR